MLTTVRVAIVVMITHSDACLKTRLLTCLSTWLSEQRGEKKLTDVAATQQVNNTINQEPAVCIEAPVICPTWSYKG